MSSDQPKPVSRPITPDQLRNARAALRLSAERLAVRSDTTMHIVNQYEKFGRVASMRWQDHDFDALAAIRTALEAAGIEFTDGDQPGVKLKRKDESNA